ncbi:MAG: hypothetical protein EBX41_02220 [Chitinophagia bacterium]|nr:hypothetical protein [Chitinophagia bacterium]
MKNLLSLLLLLFSALCCQAQGEVNEFAQARVLILLDQSSSMLNNWSGGGAKYLAARQIVLQLMDSVWSVNREVEFSLRVFGSRHTSQENDCYDTQNEVPFSKYNRTQMELRMENIRPLGVTAIAYSLMQAAKEDLVDEKYNAYSIVLITDGGESCGGDICAVMEMLFKKKIFFKPYILSLEADPGLAKEYDCMGNYLQIANKAEMPKAIGTIVKAFMPMLKLKGEDYDKIKTIAANVPSAIKVKPSIVKVATPADSIKHTRPKDSVAIVKRDTIVKKDTLAAPPKISRIKVDEHAEERPKPIAIVSLKAGTLIRMVTPRYVKKSIAILPLSDLKIEIKEDDIVHEIPKTPAVTALKTGSLLKLSYTAKPAKIKRIELPPLSIQIKETDIVYELPKTSNITELSAGAYKRLAVAPPKLKKISTIPVIPLEIKIKEDDIVYDKPAPTALATLGTGKLILKSTTSFKPKALKPITLPPLTITLLEPEPEPLPKVPELVKLKVGSYKRMAREFMLEERILEPRKLPPPPKFDFIAPPPASTPVKTVVKPAPIPKTGEYSVFNEDAKASSLEIYITDGKGKYYYTTPVVMISDNSGKEIKKFHRTIDEHNNPDPITDLPPGKYSLTLQGREDLLVTFEIVPGKKCKINIIARKFSLIFYYVGDMNRPVKEFEARVTQRNVATGKVVVQKCVEKLEYEPGNYHIEINTLPRDVRNLDLDAETAGSIGIPQPGFVKFVNDVNCSEVTLWYQHGDRYIGFYNLKMNDPASQHFQLQPGLYQVHYSDGNSKFTTSDKVLSFTVKSLKDTEVILAK